MKAKLLSFANKSAVIVVETGAFVVDVASLPTKRVGTEFEIPAKLLENATPYGIDLSIVYPDGLCLDMQHVQDELFSQGIFSLQDLKKRPSAISGILMRMSNELGAEMYHKIKLVMEDYK